MGFLRRAAPKWVLGIWWIGLMSGLDQELMRTERTYPAFVLVTGWHRRIVLNCCYLFAVSVVLTDISKDRGNECFHFYFISFFFLHHLQEGLGWKPWLHYYWSSVKAYDLPDCSQPQRNADFLPISRLEACLISLSGRILSNSFHGVAMPHRFPFGSVAEQPSETLTGHSMARQDWGHSGFRVKLLSLMSPSWGVFLFSLCIPKTQDRTWNSSKSDKKNW